MKKNYAARYRQEEETHWWIKGRRDIIKRLMEREARDATILDIGCSGGLLIRELGQMGFEDIHGMDTSAEGIDIAKRRGMTNVQVGDAAETHFPDATFDIIIASDVLEHVEDETRVLCEWNRILKRGGRAYVFVPAFMSLWTKRDNMNSVRRYTKGELVRKLCGSMDIVRVSYWNCVLFFPKYATAWVARAMKPRTERPLFFFGPVVNALLSWLISFENALMVRGVNYPVGVSVFVLAKKR